MPGGLDEVCGILDLPDELSKNEKAGAHLRRLFTEPRVKKQKKAASDENALWEISPLEQKVEYVFADHRSNPREWEEFVEYCRQDVIAERAVQKCTDHFPLTETDRRMWVLDQKINYIGWAANKEFAQKCLNLAVKDKEAFVNRLREITHLENPVSNQQMMKWARDRGYPYNSMRKEPVHAALTDETVKLTDECRKALEMLKYAKRTSYTKLEAIISALSADGRLRDQFKFMGAPRSGRWAGKVVQLQNMARPIKVLEKKGALDKAMALINEENYPGLQEYFRDPKTKEITPVIDVVTSCIRSAFISAPGKRLDVCDLNAIENRVVGWVAGEEKILQVFRDGHCPYLDFASHWFNIPYAILDVAYHNEDPDAKFKRQISKPAVLGCGYGLSGGGWGVDPRTGDKVKTGLWKYAEDMFCPMTKDQAHEAVKVFRKTFSKVVQLWWDCEAAVRRCIKTGSTEWLGPTNLIWCDRRKRKNGTYFLRIHLPSGHCLHYIDARVENRERTGRDGLPYTQETIIYKGIDQNHKTWSDITTHGGKIVENIVQAISRDILVEAMLLADEIGLTIVGHVHDEIATENDDTPEGLGLEDLTWCMSQVPKWAPGLPLIAKGYTGYYYKK
jgi:DNA polymerase